jgi:hypothetical protein
LGNVADSSLLPASVSFSSFQLLSIMPIFLAAGVLRVRNCQVTSLISGFAGPLSTVTPIAVVIFCLTTPMKRVWAPPITNMTVPATASASASTIAEFL